MIKKLTFLATLALAAPAAAWGGGFSAGVPTYSTSSGPNPAAGWTDGGSHVYLTTETDSVVIGQSSACSTASVCVIKTAVDSSDGVFVQNADTGNSTVSVTVGQNATTKFIDLTHVNDGANNSDLINRPASGVLSAGTSSDLIIVAQGSAESVLIAAGGTGNGKERIAVSGGSVVINEQSSAGVDFRVESNDQASAFVVAGTANTATFNVPLSSASNTTLGDSLTGDSVTVTGAVQGATPLCFDGATDDTNETCVTLADPGADITLTLPASTGTIALLSDIASGTIDGTMVANRVPYGVDANTLTTSADLTFDGNELAVGDNVVVDGSADEVTFRIQNHSSMTANSFVLEKSDGSDLITHDADNDLDIYGETLSPVVAANGFAVNGTFAARRAAGTQASPTNVSAEESVLAVIGQGYGESAYQSAAQILFAVDGTPSSGGDTSDMPGRISLWVSADGSSTLTQRFALLNNGDLLLEGAGADDVNELTITVPLLSADRTLTLPDASVTVNAAGDLSGTTIAAGVTASSLTSVGTLTGLTVSGSVAFNGATTIGDASGDTLTANAAAWTLANDTTVALSGGVNGINFDSNTLSIDATNNRVGIGTAAPSYNLDVVQNSSYATVRVSNNSGTGATATELILQEGAQTALDILHINSGNNNADLYSLAASGLITTGASDTGGLVLSARETSSAIILAAGGVALTDERVRIDSSNALFHGATPIVFEGATRDASEFSFAVPDVTADRTWTLSQVPVTANTGSLSPTVANGSGVLYTNEGDADGSSIALPDVSAAGAVFEVYVQAGQTITITCTGAESIVYAAVTDADDSISSNTAGSYIRLVSVNATTWVVTAITGTWVIV